MVEKVVGIIQKHNLIEKGEGVVVGVSGGPDSVCLLHVLQLLREPLEFRLFAFHLNHGLRGNEADADESYAAELCAKLDVPFKKEFRDIRAIAETRGISLEEAGRETRYALMQQYAKEAGASKIAVAHNRNDQAETILMHMARGTGLKGLTGMAFIQGNIIRPLLDTDRSEIEAYCREKGLKLRMDSSNTSRAYTRNKIRLDLIPQMDRLFDTNITDNLLRMSQLLQMDQDYLEGAAEESLRRCFHKDGDGRCWLDSTKLMTNHPAIANRVLRCAIYEVTGDLKGIEGKHIAALLELSFSGRTGARMNLPQGLLAEKSYGRLKIFRGENKTIHPVEYDYPVKIPGTTQAEAISASLEARLIEAPEDRTPYFRPDPKGWVQFFDYEKLEKGINIRSRKAGDIFKPWRSNGTKKLKEYLIDKKIPREERDKIPLVARDGEVLWLIGHKISDKFKVTENTKCILCLTFNLY